MGHSWGGKGHRLHPFPPHALPAHTQEKLSGLRKPFVGKSAQQTSGGMPQTQEYQATTFKSAK
jgi:hypothetical protein